MSSNGGHLPAMSRWIQAMSPVVRRRDLQMGERELRAAVEMGRLHRVAAGWYATPGSPSREVEAVAAGGRLGSTTHAEVLRSTRRIGLGDTGPPVAPPEPVPGREPAGAGRCWALRSQGRSFAPPRVRQRRVPPRPGSGPVTRPCGHGSRLHGDPALLWPDPLLVGRHESGVAGRAPDTPAPPRAHSSQTSVTRWGDVGYETTSPRLVTPDLFAPGFVCGVSARRPDPSRPRVQARASTPSSRCRPRTGIRRRTASSGRCLPTRW